MVKTKIRRRKGILGILLFIFITLTPVRVSVTGESFKVFSVSINNLNLKKEEYVVGFQVVLLWAYVYSLPRIPPGYNIYIENDPMWKTIIRGDISGPIRAVAVGETFFQEFLLIQEMLHVKMKPQIEMVVRVTKEEDIDETREIVVPERDILVKEISKIEKKR